MIKHSVMKIISIENTAMNIFCTIASLTISDLNNITAK